MKLTSGTLLPVALMVIWETVAAAAPADATLTVLVYDYAGLTPAALRSVESGTNLLLSRAGIRTDWVLCRTAWTSEVSEICNVNATGTRVVIRILDHRIWSKENRGNPLGIAVVESHYATVYAREIRKTAAKGSVACTDLMASVAAHEIAHLLLGPQHAGSGIMQRVWRDADYRDIAHLWLTFDAAQRDAMQNRIRGNVQTASIER